MKISILIPTLNAGNDWKKVLESVNEQTTEFYNKIIVDSGSRDDTVPLAKQFGFIVKEIDKSEFNHGATRQLLVDLSNDAEICIFLTQDAILHTKDSISNIVDVFNDPKVGMAYGRQLPHINAKPLEIHARLFNYPDQSEIVSMTDLDQKGFKIFFCSNSFSAYRRSVLSAVGGFPLGSIMGEDAIVAAKMLKAGYKKAYVANATVRHSHSYALIDEYRRYFDTRVFHEQNIWMLKEYGKPTGEGFKFIKSELSYVLKNSPASIFKSVASIFAKLLGYNSGKIYKKLPKGVVKKLSMHSFYWK